MRTATLFALLSLPLSAGSVTVVNNCGGNDLCIVAGTVDGFGTTVFSASLTATGNNTSVGDDPGPGGSGSVTIDETGATGGPVRPGFIEFSYQCVAIQPGPCNSTGTTSLGASAAASFTVGDIAGSVPGSAGVPMPIAEEFLPFTLGVPFEITASASFDVPPGGVNPIQFGSADLYFSFSLFESVTVNGSPFTFPGAAVTHRGSGLGS